MTRPVRTRLEAALQEARASWDQDILRLRARGLTVAAIARRLGMSERTVYRTLASHRKANRTSPGRQR